MERIEKYGIFCRSWEGGWSKNPNDPGGATMKGVTYKTFCDHRKSKGMPKPTEAELRKITDKEWNEILRTPYHLNNMAFKDSLMYVACEYGYWVINLNTMVPAQPCP